MIVELCENVVSTDYIENSTLHYFTYATPWTDTEHVKKFKSAEQALDWYEENMHERVVEQGKYWLQEDGEQNITDDDAVDEWRTIVECQMFC